MALTVNQALVAKLGLDSAEFDRGLKSANRQAESMGQKIGRGMRRASVAIAAAGVAVTALAISLLKAGSTAVATRSRFETVFGKSTQAVDAFNSEFKKISALSTQAFEDVIARTGAIAQGMGFAQKESAEFAIEITKLAADLGSFNELPTAETAMIINAALTGERESLKRLGIVFKEEDVTARAFENTGKELAKTLTQQEKATATLQLITERAGVAMGDASRTAGDMDRVLASLSAEWDNLKNKLGEFLATSPMVRDFLIEVRDLMSQTVAILSLSGDQINVAFGALGQLAGAAFGQAYLGTLKKLDLIAAIPGVGEFLSKLNPAMHVIDAAMAAAKASADDAKAALLELAEQAATSLAATAAGTDAVTESTEEVTGKTKAWVEHWKHFGDVIQFKVQEGFLAILNEQRMVFVEAELTTQEMAKHAEGARLIAAIMQNEVVPPTSEWSQRLKNAGRTIESNISSGITDVVLGMKSATAAAKSLGAMLVRAVVAALVRAVAQAVALKGILAAINKQKGGIGGLSRGLLSFVPGGSLISGIAGMFGFQHGGIVPGGMMPPQFAPAGFNGGIPIMAHPGEVVLSREAVQELGGPQRANQLNQEGSPGPRGRTTLNLSFPGISNMADLRRELPAIIRDLQRKRLL